MCIRDRPPARAGLKYLQGVSGCAEHTPKNGKRPFFPCCPHTFLFPVQTVFNPMNTVPFAFSSVRIDIHRLVRLPLFFSLCMHENTAVQAEMLLLLPYPVLCCIKCHAYAFSFLRMRYASSNSLIRLSVAISTVLDSASTVRDPICGVRMKLSI